ncbi:MAG: DNA repair protein RadC [Clostridia bacterium]|nr:DNA repair protein RadC [Clostridia bacterium]
MTDKDSSIHAGHRERLRERFLQEGLDGFSQHEVLELLLTFVIPQKDVNPLAHTLIDHFGSLSGVLDADQNDLMQISGVGPKTASFLCLIPSLLGRYVKSAMGDRPLLETPALAKRYAASLFFGVHDERFYIVCLDKQSRAIYTRLLHQGTVDEVPVYPRTVAQIAIRHHACGVLLIHNHPGGIAQPSQADYEATTAVIQALSPLHIGVVDHLIFSGSEVYSMTEHSETGGESSVSYVMRSSNVPGRRGTLKEEDEGLLFLSAVTR